MQRRPCPGQVSDKGPARPPPRLNDLTASWLRIGCLMARGVTWWRKKWGHEKGSGLAERDRAIELSSIGLNARSCYFTSVFMSASSRVPLPPPSALFPLIRYTNSSGMASASGRLQSLTSGGPFTPSISSFPLPSEIPFLLERWSAHRWPFGVAMFLFQIDRLGSEGINVLPSEPVDCGSRAVNGRRRRRYDNVQNRMLNVPPEARIDRLILVDIKTHRSILSWSGLNPIPFCRNAMLLSTEPPLLY
ncbi:hypothetical protein EVAR_36660_1 [Eumeta japonica]|uniref:Uncharacterized protein n=1 Tax=Eumeta variegata TaxID=151549 RepID=A0A4C1XWQ7_EUMVA|nr:hypothetical protein EVAR_36660_1 [Eumeta japonica]